jgi:hypothetical protein
LHDFHGPDNRVECDRLAASEENQARPSGIGEVVLAGASLTQRAKSLRTCRGWTGR